MKYLWLILLSVCFFSCEKTIPIDTTQQSPKVVVEAQIEAAQPPIVVLSTSLDYFSTIDTAKLNNTYIHGAKVSVSDGSNTYTLKEFSTPIGNGYFLYYYSVPGVLSPLFGIPGKKYDLKIETGSQVFTASTTIPLPLKTLDSLWWKKAPNNQDTGKVVLMSRITDPPGFGNYMRYFTKVNSDVFYPGYNSVFDDQIIDGKTYDIQVDRGVSRTDKLNFDDYGYFKRGDTVTVKFCNIDKASFDFWRTWEFAYQSIGNPFSSPGKVIGNISGGALGSFCGYSVQYRSLIIPK